MLVRELDQMAAALERERPAARVLEGRVRVEERRRRAVAEVALEHRRVEPLVVQRHADDLGAEPREDLQRPVVGRRLDEHAVAGADELVRDEAEALERARGHDHARRLDAVAGGDPLAQRPVPAAGPVRQDRAAVPLDHGAGAVGHLRDGKALGRGHAARKGDDIHDGQSRDTPGGSAPVYRMRSATSCATSVGVVPTWIPRASSASFFACAVPDEPEMIAPAWPIVLPGGAEKPAM